MREQGEADGVARQYEKWRYPTPIEDLPRWLENRWEWFDPSHAHALLWPDRPYKPGMDILIAGCGTNQAAVFAYTNPDARVTAIDVSDASLAHARHLKDRHGLHNLELYQVPVEEAATLGRDFDLVVCTGVLHHLADPVAGLRALAACARRDAAIAVMLYARYGRAGVALLQSAFQRLRLRQDEASLATVRQVLAMLPSSHPARGYLALASDLDSDAAFVDTFLHARERDYTVRDCLDLVSSAGLAFQAWFHHAPYYVHDFFTGETRASRALKALSEADLWSTMEEINATNACHFFIAARIDRPRSTYAVEFSGSAWLDYVPAFRKGCTFAAGRISRPDWSLELGEGHAALAALVDGKRCLADIASAAGEGARSPDQEAVRGLFQALWRLDFLSMTMRKAL